MDRGPITLAYAPGLRTSRRRRAGFPPDLAIATGILQQTVRVKASGATVDMQAATTQNWIRRGGRWLLITFQATRLG